MMTSRCWLAGVGLVCAFTVDAAAQTGTAQTGTAQTGTAQTGSVARAAQLLRAGGTVELRRGAAVAWARARPGDELRRGDAIRTHPASFAQLTFDVGGQWQLAAESELDLTPAITDGPGRITVRLERGGAVSRWRPDQSANARLTVATPSGQAGIVGTEWSLRVEPDGTSTLLVLDGRVDFGNELGSVSVAANEAAEMAVGRPPSLLRLISPEDRVQWVAAYQPNPARYSVGGDTLANTELIQADALIGAGEMAAARARVEAGQKRFPADARFDALLSRLTLFEGESAASRAAADAAVAKDSTAVDGWLALGEWGIREGDLAVAQRGFTEAGLVAPQDARAWFGLGSIASDREEFPSARRFLGTALALDPDGPGYRGQLGMTNTLANQLTAATKEYAAALEQQPDDYVSLTGRALLALKQGREGEAIELLQRVTLFEPRYARAHMYLGVAYYRTRRVEDAIRELARASREDPRDPLPFMMLTQIHTDLYEPAKAIEAGRQARTLMPYLKSLNQLAMTPKGAANLGNALAYFGMEPWADHLAQQSYSPLWAGSHLFLGDRYSSDYARSSEYFQGLIEDPTVFGGSPMFQSLLPRRGRYSSADLKFDQTSPSDRGVRIAETVNGLANGRWPVAYVFSANAGATSSNAAYAGDFWTTRDRRITSNATASIGMAPTPSWGLFATASLVSDRQRLGITEDNFNEQFNWSRSAVRFDLGSRYRPSPTSSVGVKLGWSSLRVDSPFGAENPLVRYTARPFEITARYIAQVGRHQPSVGVDYGHDSPEFVYASLESFQLGRSDTRTRERQASTSVFASDRVQWGPLLFQGDLFVNREAGTEHSPNGLARAATFVRVRPRAGASLGRGTTVLRVAYQDWIRPQAQSATLGPVATAGIPLDDSLALSGGDLRRIRAQLDREWSARTFTRGFVERVRMHSVFTVPAPLLTLSLLQNLFLAKQPAQAQGALPDVTHVINELRRLVLDASRSNVAGRSSLEEHPNVHHGTAVSAGGAINQVVTPRVSVHGQYQFTNSSGVPLILGEPYLVSGERALPFLPRHAVAVGSTWVDPRRWYVSGEVTCRTGRFENPYLLIYLQLQPRRPADCAGRVAGSWESASKRWSIEFDADDLFRRAPDAEVAEFARAAPSPSYTVRATWRR